MYQTHLVAFFRFPGLFSVSKWLVSSLGASFGSSVNSCEYKFRICILDTSLRLQDRKNKVSLRLLLLCVPVLKMSSLDEFGWDMLRLTVDHSCQGVRWTAKRTKTNSVFSAHQTQIWSNLQTACACCGRSWCYDVLWVLSNCEQYYGNFMIFHVFYVVLLPILPSDGLSRFIHPGEASAKRLVMSPLLCWLLFGNLFKHHVALAGGHQGSDDLFIWSLTEFESYRPIGHFLQHQLISPLPAVQVVAKWWAHLGFGFPNSKALPGAVPGCHFLLFVCLVPTKTDWGCISWSVLSCHEWCQKYQPIMELCKHNRKTQGQRC